jgi:hypothetical protein
VREHLADEVDRDLIASWTYGHKKWAARSLGGLNRPSIHSVELPSCKHCAVCKRWYVGKWAYRKAE